MYMKLGILGILECSIFLLDSHCSYDDYEPIAVSIETYHLGTPISNALKHDTQSESCRMRFSMIETMALQPTDLLFQC
jgi:hypothetical protein